MIIANRRAAQRMTAMPMPHAMLHLPLTYLHMTTMDAMDFRYL